jgi:hypothetical protein
VHDLCVERAPTIVEETVVGNVMRESVTERVLDVGEELRLVEELGGLEMSHALPKTLLWQFRNPLKKSEWDVFADDRRSLK